MPLYSSLFKHRKRKTPPAPYTALGIARYQSILEQLSCALTDSPIDANTKKLLEQELSHIIHTRTAASYSSEAAWQDLIIAVRAVNLEQGVKRNSRYEVPPFDEMDEDDMDEDDEDEEDEKDEEDEDEEDELVEMNLTSLLPLIDSPENTWQ